MEKQGEDDDSNSMDRISELPQPILHHIISFLSEEYAFRTRGLSKLWYHLWCTRPNIELCDFKKKELLLPVLDKVLQRYHDQNLSIHEFCLRLSKLDSETVLILNKWLPIVKIFNLYLFSRENWDWDIPLAVLETESLKNLYLESCTLSLNSSIGKKLLLFKHLQTLHLRRVYITDETFEKITSSCPRLKSLSLSEIKLSNVSFNFFSSNQLPSLEYLDLHHCYGFNEFHLLSRSIKHLIIVLNWKESIVRATIDASNILYFKYSSHCLPSISFTTTTCSDHEWKSDILLSFEKVDADSSWLLKLNQLLVGLRHSEISLTLLNSRWKKIEDALLLQDDDNTRFYRPPVVVEHLVLRFHPAASFSAFIHELLLRVCHPRNIGWRHLPSHPKCLLHLEPKRKQQLNQLFYEILIMERETTTDHYLWRQDLEEVSVEAFDESGKQQWHHPVQGTSLFDHNELRFRLKWREMYT